jgi:hypothetical protein
VHNNGIEEIQGGTVDKLIEKLYNQDQLAREWSLSSLWYDVVGITLLLIVSDYVDAFLLTYRSFTDFDRVWNHLKTTYLLFIFDF